MNRIHVFLLVLSLLIASIFTACTGGDENPETSAPEKPVQTENSASERGIAVEVMVVKADVVKQSIPVTGVLQPFHVVDLIAEQSGKITQVKAELGTRVSLRDTLAYIDDKVALSNFRQARAQVLSAENNLKIARLNLESDKQLFENGDISRLAYENSMLTVKTAVANLSSAHAGLSLNKKNYLDTRITSPIRGQISRKDIDLGTMVNPGQRLFRVVDLSHLKIQIGIPQSIIGKIHIGSDAIIRVSALNNAVFTGTVKYISPQADESTGAFTTEIHVRNTSDQQIRAGMTALVEIVLTDDTRQISIPDYALVSRGGEDHIYKIDGQHAVLTRISVDETIGSSVVLNSGLAEGDTIVTVGMKNLGVRTRVWVDQQN